MSQYKSNILHNDNTYNQFKNSYFCKVRILPSMLLP